LTGSITNSAVKNTVAKIKTSACGDISNAPALYQIWLQLTTGGGSGDGGNNTGNSTSDCAAELAAKDSEIATLTASLADRELLLDEYLEDILQYEADIQEKNRIIAELNTQIGTGEDDCNAKVKEAITGLTATLTCYMTEAPTANCPISAATKLVLARSRISLKSLSG
jgi:hypothetical protein